jgi:hypothetical protein
MSRVMDSDISKGQSATVFIAEVYVIGAIRPLDSEVSAIPLADLHKIQVHMAWPSKQRVVNLLGDPRLVKIARNASQPIFYLLALLEAWSILSILVLISKTVMPDSGQGLQDALGVHLAPFILFEAQEAAQCLLGPWADDSISHELVPKAEKALLNLEDSRQTFILKVWSRRKDKISIEVKRGPKTSGGLRPVDW